MKIKRRIISIIIMLIQLFTIIGNLGVVNANINAGDIITLQGDHECDSLVEYLTSSGWWSYKVVWYVYYLNGNNKYPAFCVEPAKQGVGTGYTSYNATISKENDNAIWRILKKGYMGSRWTDWDLECDDDLYSATKIALHSYAENISPNSKYVLGDRSVDGNSVETIQRRGAKVLNVAQSLYEYGLNGKEIYQTPKISIKENKEYEIETINDIEYYVQNYKVEANNYLKSYKISIDDFVSGTKIFNSNNKEVTTLENNYFKIAIPTKNIKEHIDGSINITDAQIKSCPVYYAQSHESGAQCYVTYTSGYEIASTNANLVIDSNTCNLKIKKVDNETKEAVPNVEFEILSEKGESLGKWTTNEDGIIEINGLTPGIVKVKEINADDKYIINEEEKEVKLEWGKTSEIEIGNDHKKGSIKVIKTDANNNKIRLQAVEFNLYNEQHEIIKTLITDKNGEAKADDLDVGTYILKETKTNVDYILDEKEYTIQIQEDKETVVINISNKQKTKLPRTGF